MVSRKKKDLSRLAFVIIGLLLLNWLAAALFFRVDFTAEKRFSLAAASKETVKSLDDQLDVIVYLDGDFPAGLQRLQNSTKYLLNNLRAYSGGKLTFDFVDPLSGGEQSRAEVDEKLAALGVTPVQVGVAKENGLSQIMVYPAALLRYHGKELAVNLLSSGEAISQESLNEDSENLEYAVVSGIRKLMADGKQLIGISEGHGELNDLELYDAMNALSAGFDVRRVALSEVSTAGLDKMKLLIVAKPQTAFTNLEKYKIDYFVMHGGRVLWSIDNVTAELDSLRRTGSEMSVPKKLNLDDLLFNYGARVNYELIADMNCAPIPISTGPAGSGQLTLAPWLYFPVFVPQSAHPVVRNLQGIRGEFVNTVDTIAVAGVKKEFILTSSAYSRVALSPAMISLQMVRQEADATAFKDRGLPAAVMLEGSFPSAYAGRPVPEGVNGGAAVSRSPFTKMIVIGDGDIFKNQVNGADGSPFPLGYDRFSQKQYANKTLLLNMADFLTDDNGLITLRNRQISVRLLDRARIRETRLLWQVINIGLPLLLLLFAGAAQYVWRHRTFGLK